MINLKKEFKNIGLGLGYVIAIVLLVSFFKLNWWKTWILLSGINLALVIWKKQFKIFGFLKTVITIGAFIFCFRFISRFGKWGYILSIILVVLYILLRKRKEFTYVKQTIETMLWGKPLRKYVENKEKLPKIKISSIKKHS